MKVTLAASGGGTKETMTVQCARALEHAQYVIGAGRLLAALGRSVPHRKSKRYIRMMFAARCWR